MISLEVLDSVDFVQLMVVEYFDVFIVKKVQVYFVSVIPNAYHECPFNEENSDFLVDW